MISQAFKLVCISISDMARKRVVKTYKDTRAKGDRAKIEGNRYFLLVELISAKVEEEADAIGRISEIYFKINRTRCPNKGVINLERNEVFKPQNGLTLYSEFKEVKKDKDHHIRLRVFDQDISKDDELIDEKVNFKFGQSREYYAFAKNGIRVKIAISALKTRY